MVADGWVISGIVNGWVALAVSAGALLFGRSKDKTVETLLTEVIKTRRRQDRRVDTLTKWMGEIAMKLAGTREEGR